MQNYATFKDLEDTSVFITGGGSGIGASITEGFLSQGAKVAFVQRSDCDEFLSKVSSKYKYKPLFIKCDITRTDDLKNAIAHASQVNGGINVLINNAANDTRHTLEEMTSAEWDEAININLKPHFPLSHGVSNNGIIPTSKVCNNSTSLSSLQGITSISTPGISKGPEPIKRTLISLLEHISDNIGTTKLRYLAVDGEPIHPMVNTSSNLRDLLK